VAARGGEECHVAARGGEEGGSATWQHGVVRRGGPCASYLLIDGTHAAPDEAERGVAVGQVEIDLNHAHKAIYTVHKCYKYK
jgi:hypothetical protein